MRSDTWAEIRITGKKQPCENFGESVPDRGTGKGKVSKIWHVRETEMPECLNKSINIAFLKCFCKAYGSQCFVFV